VHRPSVRVKDVSPWREESFLRTLASGARALWRRADDVPLLGVPKSTHCHRCDRPPRRRPLRTCRTDRDLRSTGIPRRLPTFRRPGAFHRRDHGHSRGSLLQVSRAGLPLTPSTRFPRSGERCFFWTLQAPAQCYPRGLRESRRLFEPAGKSCLGLTTQARQRGPTDAAFRGS